MADGSIAGELAEDESTSIRSAPTFKLFPKLPLELRLKIWRLNFPEPRILKNVSVNYWGTWNGKPFPVHHPKAQQPVTLFVNHESRTETLRAYRDLSKSLDTCKKPVYFSPARDAIHLGAIMSFTRAGNCVRYQAERMDQVIERLSYIQVLILDGLYVNERHRWGLGPDSTELEGGILAKFHCLRKLFLLRGWDRKVRAGRAGATAEQCEELFRRYFETEKQKWPDCRIPEITIVLPSDAVVWPEGSD